MLFCLLIVDQNITILVVPVRLVLCNLDSSEDRVRLDKNVVHLFKRSVRRLGIEEIGDG